MRTTPEIITHLEPNEIFVFGSNLAGRHGKGAAKDAMKFGARYGIPRGLVGQSYAIPTKDERLQTLDLKDISIEVHWFMQDAIRFRELIFLVTPIGCGLAGYRPEDIAPMFSGHPLNVVLPLSFQQVIYLPLFGADLD